MAEHRDITFESLLRSTLKAEALSLPVSVGPAAILRRRDLRQRGSSRRRLRLLLIAALLALPLGALLIGAPRPAPAPAAYSAVLVRGGVGEPELQVLVASDGVAERVVDVPVSRFGAIEVGGVLEASASGWIALHAADRSIHQEYVVLFDVRSPDAAPLIREGASLGAWTPDGLYWSATNTVYELIDPASGQVITLPRGASGNFDWWETGNGRMQVAAEGHGLLLLIRRYDLTGHLYPQQWGVLSPDGTLSPGLPDVAEGVGRRDVSPNWGLLQPRSNGASSGRAADGTYRQWGDAPPLHHYLADASWAVDGGVWLLVDRRSDGRTMLLIHRDENNVDREVASFNVDLDEYVTIGDLAADDSLIALQLSGKFPFLQTVIVDTRSGTSHLFDGALGGFVPAAAARGWVTGERLTEAGQVLSSLARDGGSGPAYVPLPSLQQQTASLFADRILLVHEVEATSADPGPPTQLTLGPLEEGIGISLACSGPGVITLTLKPGDTPDTYRCVSPSGYGGTEAPDQRWASAIQVEYDASTTWRLIIYDPPPPHIRRP